MDASLRPFLVSIAKGALPYHDPGQRRTVRAAARRLVCCEPWPDDDIVTGRDIAQLTLLRLLWLQKEAHRADRRRQAEATILLARSAVEACILGLYCLHMPDAPERMKAANLKAMTRLLQYVVTDGIIPKSAIDQSLAALGANVKDAPDVFQMALYVEKQPGGEGAVSLYQRFYIPTSTFFVHASPASLLRHVGPEGKLTDKPLVPWTRRSAVHIADACVGMLAAAIIEQDAVAKAKFEKYARSHAERALTPLAVIVGKGLRGAIKVAEVPALVRQFTDLKKYTQSASARSDDPSTREARIRSDFEALARPVVADMPKSVYEPLLDFFAAEISSRLSESGGAELTQESQDRESDDGQPDPAPPR